MTWTKLSDDFSDDCWQLSDPAWRLHVEGLLWSNRKLLDLRLAKDEMRLWAKHPEAVAELVGKGWWQDDGDAYVIVHHAVYQRTRESVLAQQKANQENGRKGGRPPGPPREQRPRQSRRETEALTESERDSLTDSPTEMDRTGQDRLLTTEPPTELTKPGCSACAVRPAQGDPHPFPHLCGDCLESQKDPSMQGAVWSDYR